MRDCDCMWVDGGRSAPSDPIPNDFLRLPPRSESRSKDASVSGSPRPAHCCDATELWLLTVHRLLREEVGGETEWRPSSPPESWLTSRLPIAAVKEFVGEGCCEVWAGRDKGEPRAGVPTMSGDDAGVCARLLVDE